MNTEQLRDYAKRMYNEHFKPNQCEDEWYHYDIWSAEDGETKYWINIFKWSKDGPTVVNIYEGPDADNLKAIDDFILED